MRTGHETVNHKRDPKWDNVKALLIFTVVLGHFADKFCSSNARVQGLFMFIYVFHMPAFVYVSGLFSKNAINRATGFWEKAIPFLYMSVLLNIFRTLTMLPWNPDAQFKLIKYNNVSWYLFAIFVFMLITRALRRVNKALVLIAAISLAFAIGYCDGLGSTLAIYRIANLYLFFYLGYITNPERLSSFTEKKSAKAVSACLLVAWLLLCLRYPKQLYSYRKLITCANSYADAGLDIDGTTWIFRAVDIIVILIIMFAVFTVVPKCRYHNITKIGERTLAIYFWHLAFVEIIVHSNIFVSLISTSNIVLLLSFIVASALIICTLSIYWFSVPLEFMMNLPARIKTLMKTT